MSVIRCQHCRTPMEWLATTLGKRLPFDHALVELAELGDRQGWLITRRGDRALAAPLDHVGERLRQGAQRVLVVHACEGYRQASTQKSAPGQHP